MPQTQENKTLAGLHTGHARRFDSNRYVYPVLSRRSRGISVGINLNPDKVCNFDCIYCQVDRTIASDVRNVDIALLLEELNATLDLVTTGGLYVLEPFRKVPESLRRLNDIAFSGDGEPTTYRGLEALVTQIAAIKAARNLNATKLVLITNATIFHRPNVRKALEILDANQGEIWAKLDAGSEAYYRKVERTTIPFQRILDNLLEAATVRPLVIQSLFMRIDGHGPSKTEICEYCDRLAEIFASGGKIGSVQVYTVARRPAESSVAALSPEEVDEISAEVRRRIDCPVESYYGPAA